MRLLFKRKIKNHKAFDGQIRRPVPTMNPSVFDILQSDEIF